jgi:hypothetical protein
LFLAANGVKKKTSPGRMAREVSKGSRTAYVFEASGTEKSGASETVVSDVPTLDKEIVNGLPVEGVRHFILGIVKSSLI